MWFLGLLWFRNVCFVFFRSLGVNRRRVCFFRCWRIRSLDWVVYRFCFGEGCRFVGLRYLDFVSCWSGLNCWEEVGFLG